MITKTNDGCMRITRRTLNAYHACLSDFTFTSLVTSFFLPAILLGYWTFYSAFLFSRLQSLKAGPFIIGRVPLPQDFSQLSLARRHSSTTRYTTRRSLSISAKEFFSHPAAGFWHLPLRGDIPPRPDLSLLYCLFFFLYSLASFPFLLTQLVADRQAINCSRRLSAVSTSDCAL